jgi:hypothetical protein
MDMQAMLSSMFIGMGEINQLTFFEYFYIKTSFSFYIYSVSFWCVAKVIGTARLIRPIYIPNFMPGGVVVIVQIVVYMPKDAARAAIAIPTYLHLRAWCYIIRLPPSTPTVVEPIRSILSG